MHQSRRRPVTQGTLELERLYWNRRGYHEGRRRRRSTSAPGLGTAQLLVPGQARFAKADQAHEPTRRSVKFGGCTLGRSPFLSFSQEMSGPLTAIAGHDNREYVS